MKKKYIVLIICVVILGSWILYSVNQPASIVGKSENWKATYKPRKGMDGVDSISYPWYGRIKWRHMFREPQIYSVDLLIDNKYVNKYVKADAKKGGGNFDGKTMTDYDTFYDGPDKSVAGMRITWQENGKSHTESFKFKRKKRLLVIPLVFPLF